VLVEPSHPGNVGAAARAMRVMGLRELALVRPRVPEALQHANAVAFASGARDVLDAARVYATLDDALADAGLAVAVSASTREFGAAPLDPDRCAQEVIEELTADGALRVAIVFGPERTGLTIGDVQRCQRVCTIPGEPDYHSLNLAQAVQLIAWMLRRQALGETVPVPADDAEATSRRAPAGEVEAFFAHLERALVAVQFLDPAHPKKLMPRLRRLFARAGLESEEVQLLRGMCKQMELAAQQRLPRKASPSAEVSDTP
jgi:tRNA/rRNA methyltransferase